jgi:hypothetical protein
MTRNNADFQQSALFHGTVHPFQIGDIIEPRNGNPVYAGSLEYAENHAARREDHEYNRIANEKGHEEAAKITGKVFEVEPLDETEETGKGDDKGNVMSSKGFRVIRQVK